jgi:hypothetical protein
MSYSPNKMGHESPAKNQNKGYAKQERKDLMQDMPIVKDAMGGRSWMSKHSKSALHMGHSPAEMGHSPAEMGHESPAEMHGGFHAGDAAKAFAGAAIKTAKKVKAAGTKIAKKVKEDLFEGGAERHRKKFFEPAKVFKK